MKGEVIHILCKRDPFLKSRFVGFSSPDVPIPKIHKFPALFILNTDISTGPGRHWCTATFFNNGVCEFFDPLGHPPDFYHFQKELFKKCKRIVYNGTPVQSNFSKTCGHHCIMFNYFRAREMSSECIFTEYYTDSLNLNDHKAFLFIFNTFGPQFALIEKDNQNYRGY